MTVLGILFIVLGALGPIAAAQWRQGRWLESGRWIVRSFSPHLLAGIPTAGIFLMTLGLSFIWPPAIILAFLSAGAYLWVLFLSASKAEAEASGQAASRPESRAPSRPTGRDSRPPTASNAEERAPQRMSQTRQAG